MTIPEVFKEYIWLVETISRHERITFAELSDLWKRREDTTGAEFSRTTFNRHRDAIMDMFGIIIDCDRRDGYRYFIYNKDVLHEDSVQNWMFSTLSVSNMLAENMALHSRILLESIPSGNDTLQHIIRAMHDNRRIMITYRRYGAAAANSFSVAPYCVKLFRRRWYLLATLRRWQYSSSDNESDEQFGVFSLDRIEDTVIQAYKFTIKPSFDATKFFNDCFGIVVGDGTKAERIVVRAYGTEPHYMRDLPLHHSQKELKQTDDYTDFELFLRPTPDFKGHILSKGQWLQVISPQWLALEIKQWHQDAINRYSAISDQ